MKIYVVFILTGMLFSIIGYGQAKPVGIAPLTPSKLLEFLPDTPEGWQLKMSNGSNEFQDWQIARAVRVFEYRDPDNKDAPPALVRISITDTAKKGFELVQFEAAINDVYKKFSAFDSVNNSLDLIGTEAEAPGRDNRRVVKSSGEKLDDASPTQIKTIQDNFEPAPARPLTVEGQPGIYSKQGSIEHLRLLLGERFIIEVFQKDSGETSPEQWIARIQLKLLNESGSQSKEVSARENVVITRIDELNPENNSKFVTTKSNPENGKKVPAPNPEDIRRAFINGSKNP